jgi:hypothetical protein
MPEPELSGVDRVRSLVAGYAHGCLGELLRAAGPPRPEVAACSEAGWMVLLLAFPALPGERGTGLTECDRDCLVLLSQAQEVMSAPAVRRELEKRGRIHAGITVKRSLRRLADLGAVACFRKQPRGYLLRDHGPLFRPNAGS